MESLSPAGSRPWRLRRYRDGHRLLIHALPARVETVLNKNLENQFIHQRIVEKLQYTPLSGELVVEPTNSFTQVRLHSPDLPEARAGSRKSGKAWTIDTAGVSRYFVLECFG